MGHPYSHFQFPCHFAGCWKNPGGGYSPFCYAIIPIAGPILFLVVWILICNAISKNFGQGAGFTVGLVLLSVVFVPILAFGDYQWKEVK